MAGIIKTRVRAKATAIVPTDDADAFGINYLHSTLAQCGLPRRSLPIEQRTFKRANGRAALFIEAGHWRGEGIETVPLPVPSGTRPRLMLLYACTEAVRTKSPEIVLGKSVSEFLRRLGLPTSGDTMNDFRNQMTALALCRMWLDRVGSDGATRMRPLNIIDEFQAGFIEVDGTRTREPWPRTLLLTQTFVDQLREHAVPLSQTAIARLQNSSLALDVYAWLVHRLHRIEKPEGIALSWTQLHKQFGQEYRELKDFKTEMKTAFNRVCKVYPEARMELLRGRVLFLPSPPPVKPRGHLVGAPDTPKVPAPAQLLIGSTSKPEAALGVADLEMSDALKRLLRANAPGWDTYVLLGHFKEWMADKPTPHDMTKACGAWAKKFTKGKPPA